jgi:ribosomal protein L29
MAGYINVTPVTLRNWRKNKPELYEMIIKGFAFDEMVELSVENADRAKELKKELFNLRFQSTQAQLTNPKRFREVRKEISRIYTILRERELKLR